MRKISLKSIICIILCLFTGIVSGCSNHFQGNTLSSLKQDDPVSSYLCRNSAEMDISNNENFKSFKLIDDSLNGKEVFLTAETHGISVNTRLELKFLKYFKQRAGVRYYLQEMPYSEACFANQYLQTGNEKILDDIFEQLKGTPSWNKEEYSKWKEIYELNKSLPENEKIKVVGIDIEQQLILAIRYMCSILPESAPPKEISEIIKELKSLNGNENLNEESIKSFSIRLQKNIESNNNIYDKYFGDRFFDFNMVNKNIINRFEVYKYESSLDFNRTRDKYMYENFIDIYSRLPEGKFYGQFGLNHAFQKKQADVDWLASLMNADSSPVKGKVMSIIYTYIDCMMRDQHLGLTDFDSLDPTKDKFGKYAKTDFTLFKLTGENSPFEKNLIWPLYEQVSEDSATATGVTTDFFQFVILIKNSQATELLDGN